VTISETLKFFIIISMLLSLSATRALAWEVTYKEISGGYLHVTVSTTTTKAILECRSEVDGRPFGSGGALVQAGVAVILISLPEGLRHRLADFKYFCVE